MKRSFHRFRHWLVAWYKARYKSIENVYGGRFHHGIYHLDHPTRGTLKTKTRCIRGTVWLELWSDLINGTPDLYCYYECQIQDHDNRIGSPLTNTTQAIDKCYMFLLK